jgi:hypothetical protein
VEGLDLLACADHSAAIEFVSANWIATRYTFAQTEACEPRGGRWRDSLAVRPLGVQGRHDLSALLGDSADVAWDAAARAAFALMERDGWNCPPPDPELSDLTSWTIERNGGAWRAIAGANTDLGECELLHDIDFTLPDSITDEAEPSIAFSRVKQGAPTATDYLLSPESRFIVIITTNAAGGLTFDLHAVEDGRPGRKLLGDLLGSGVTRLVMVQWSSGLASGEWLQLL